MKTEVHHPEWLIDAVPGARAARDELDALLDKVAPLTDAVVTAIAARSAKGRRVRHGAAENDTQLLPRPGVTTAELDAANADLAAAHAAQDAHARKVRTARSGLDALMAAVTPQKRSEIAHRVRLEATTAAATAVDTLRSALEREHEAWGYDRTGEAEKDPTAVTIRHTGSFSLVPASSRFAPAETPQKALAILEDYVERTSAR